MRDAPVGASLLTRRDLLIGGACFAGAILGGSASVWGTHRTLPAGGLNALISIQIGEWSLARTYGVVAAEDRDGVNGPYDDLLTRIYESRAWPPITLLVAYVGSQRADVRLHRPEACYPAAGFTLSDRELVRLKFTGTPAISAQMILAESPIRTERLLYWTRVGSEFPTSNVGQLGAFVRENLAGRVPDGILMRISVPGSDRARASAAFRAFLTALLAASSPAAVRLLFGERA